MKRAVLIAIGVLMLISCITAEEPATPAIETLLDSSEKSAYIAPNLWKYQTDEAIKILKEEKFNTLYLNVGALESEDGETLSLSVRNDEESISKIQKIIDNGFTIHLWLNLSDYSKTTAEAIKHNIEEKIENAMNDYIQSLKDNGLKNKVYIHLNFEENEYAQKAMIEALKYLKKNGFKVSVSVVSSWPKKILKELNAADTITVQFYNSKALSSEAYAKFIEDGLKKLGLYIDKNKLVLVFPYYPETAYHHTSVENLEIVANILMSEISEMRLYKGLCVYAFSEVLSTKAGEKYLNYIGGNNEKYPDSYEEYRKLISEFNRLYESEVNRAPTLSISDQSVNEGETLTLNLLDYASDPDGDTLSFTLTGVGEITDAIYTFSPDYDTLGTYNVEIEVSDGNGGVAIDSFIVTVNNVVAIQFAKALGGSDEDVAFSIIQTRDGGYVVAGYTKSNDGDVSGNHGGFDYWVVKLDGTGATQWQRCLGGSSYDYAISIIQTNDGGYVVAGWTASNDGDVSGNHGYYDYWVVKLNNTGAIQWQKCLGGSYNDWAKSVYQTNDGGYVVAGITYSSDGDVSGNHGYSDYWVVKLDSTGNIQWQKCLGGSYNDWAESIIQTSDGGYVVAGFTESNDGDVTGNHGERDYWVVKLDGTGDIQWQRCLGGSGDDYAWSIIQTRDGGYVVAGITYSNDGDVSGNHGYYDYWVVKLNNTGAIQWQKCLGGSSYDYAISIIQTNDGGYVVAGWTASNDGDVSGNHGYYDYWVVKLNNTGAIQWQKCLGGSSYDFVYSIIQTNDGGYVVAGYTDSNDGDVSGNHGGLDYWVVKLDSTGAIQWQKCFGGSNNDYAYSIYQTSDGGYVVAGYTDSNDGEVSGNHGDADYWVVKFK
ncbi:hypothetical protein AT15_07600 [Kosmotoga arenicorallina S304]|uniref:Uncharacterized protein n=1 Tax=Kosmotoga arenicorallina S304 TaxID=1453497 RepID=A0A176K327_9BACT|nr:cadherin-like domain-containing protein [Kosmotoga arenicorallina]OAA31353.1 hypothetical protein AT15_07600 [Kosmotoga arenicorallina S304]